MRSGLLQMKVRHDALQQSTRAAGRAAVAAAATATEVAATPEPALPSLAVAARERGGHRRTHFVGFVGDGQLGIRPPTRSAFEDLCGRAGPWEGGRRGIGLGRGNARAARMVHVGSPMGHAAQHDTRAAE